MKKHISAFLLLLAVSVTTISDVLPQKKQLQIQPKAKKHQQK